MKTIASLSGPAFLRACNTARHAVGDYAQKTRILDLRKLQPVIPEGTPEDQVETLQIAQAKKNVDAMITRALDEYPEDTWALLRTLVLPEKDQEGKDIPLDGMDVLMAAAELLTTPKVLDFFIKLASSAELIMGA